jgi:D-serine deaminase-like pyridoxal phosphate-dependent protein
MLETLETPTLLLDADKLDANCKRMRERLDAHGVALRPHVKTAKSVEVARCALGATEGAITVSTVREAEYFFDHGFRDMLYAVGVVPNKVPRLAALNKRGANIAAIVDSVEAARALMDASASAGTQHPGADRDRQRRPSRRRGTRRRQAARDRRGARRGIARRHDPRGRLVQLRHPRTGIRGVAAREREAVVASAEALRRAGAACPVVSVGSTPTARFGESFEGRDRGAHRRLRLPRPRDGGLGVCALDDIAISVSAR